MGVLVDDDRHSDSGAQRLDHLADRLPLVDDAVAGARPQPSQQPLQGGVVERPRDEREGKVQEALHQRDQLPMAEVTREEQHALAPCVGRPDVLEPFVVHETTDVPSFVKTATPSTAESRVKISPPCPNSAILPNSSTPGSSGRAVSAP